MKYLLYIGIAAAAVLLLSLWLTEIPAAIYRKKKDSEMSLLWKALLFLLTAVLLSGTGTFAFLSIYQKADPSAESALVSDENVIVRNTDFGYFFDGWGTETAMIFYPGAKVDEKAYAPLMRGLAANGVDCFLLRLPYHMAFLEPDAADRVFESGIYFYDKWYVGGHSLGGSIASMYANEHADDLDGLILLASYPSQKVDERLILLSIYGSEDLVLNRNEYQKAYEYWPGNCREAIISGGNHSQFASYGLQNGDGEAKISPKVQVRAATEVIRLLVRKGR